MTRTTVQEVFVCTDAIVLLFRVICIETRAERKPLASTPNNKPRPKLGSIVQATSTKNGITLTFHTKQGKNGESKRPHRRALNKKRTTAERLDFIPFAAQKSIVYASKREHMMALYKNNIYLIRCAKEPSLYANVLQRI